MVENLSTISKPIANKIVGAIGSINPVGSGQNTPLIAPEMDLMSMTNEQVVQYTRRL